MASTIIPTYSAYTPHGDNPTRARKFPKYATKRPYVTTAVDPVSRFATSKVRPTTSAPSILSTSSVTPPSRLTTSRLTPTPKIHVPVNTSKKPPSSTYPVITIPPTYQRSTARPTSHDGVHEVNSVAIALGIILVLSYVVFIFAYLRRRRPNRLGRKSKDAEFKESTFSPSASPHPPKLKILAETKTIGVPHGKEAHLHQEQQPNRPHVEEGGYTSLLPVNQPVDGDGGILKVALATHWSNRMAGQLEDTPDSDGYEIVKTARPSPVPIGKVRQTGQRTGDDGYENTKTTRPIPVPKLKARPVRKAVYNDGYENTKRARPMPMPQGKGRHMWKEQDDDDYELVQTDKVKPKPKPIFRCKHTYF
ncbi:uncharacterized protein LOC135154903 [Lytechinus pictus]|uniref:uncharacterized protein LOC135154903 n=1 Tax=Lytechinus pictus TaxID=7653 RepID=UPI0030BA0F94